MYDSQPYIPVSPNGEECRKGWEAIAVALRERLGGVTPAKLDIWEAGPVIATHGGLGALGYCVAQP